VKRKLQVSQQHLRSSVYSMKSDEMSQERERGTVGEPLVIEN